MSLKAYTIAPLFPVRYMSHCWFNVGPPFATLAQYESNIVANMKSDYTESTLDIFSSFYMYDIISMTYEMTQGM